MVALATQYGRYGYRRVTALLRRDGWKVNHKRVERLWRQEGLKVPKRQPKRKRLWFNDGSCVRLRPAHRDHVWSYDFVQTRTHGGKPVWTLTVIDESTLECVTIDVARRFTQGRRLLHIAHSGEKPVGAEGVVSQRGRGRKPQASQKVERVSPYRGQLRN
ncbi:hypothetical protein Pan44_50760 [Caulifigura coniformis]|uniref:HTH-like domain-containing protein n=1 Tax=Caulifigura coniformis TaxID=2527983 RepID=A0A517SLM1_9PLAN|nr:hypothetical protein Pan44_50760 [Caulifigura coniformis]